MAMAPCIFPVSRAIGSHHGPASCKDIVDYAHLDAFTDEAFKGNPAAVCLLQSPKAVQWMQNIATEISLPMTAFLIKRTKNDEAENGVDREAAWKEANGTPLTTSLNNLHLDSQEEASEFDLRWFTPTVEVNLCGHGTLAASYLLFASGMVPESQEIILYHTRSGILTVRKVITAEKWLGMVELDFPSVTITPSSPMVHLSMSHTLRGSKVISTHKTADGDLLLQLQSAKEVETLEVYEEEILRCEERAVVVTAKGSDESPYDFVSRVFCPKYGIPEDPVCGSVHCALAPFWATKLGKKKLLAYQASKRGGELDLRVDDEASRVFIRGTAVVITVGVLVKSH